MSVNNTPENLLELLKHLKANQPYQASVFSLFKSMGFDPRWTQYLSVVLKREKIIKNTEKGNRANYLYISPVEPNIEMAKKAIVEAGKEMKEKANQANAKFRDKNKIAKQPEQTEENEEAATTAAEPEAKWKATMARNSEGKLVPKCEVYPITCMIDKLIEVTTLILDGKEPTEITMHHDKFLAFNEEYKRRINHPEEVQFVIEIKTYKGISVYYNDNASVPIMVR